jgi:hypothetical protein
MYTYIKLDAGAGHTGPARAHLFNYEPIIVLKELQKICKKFKNLSV